MEMKADRQQSEFNMAVSYLNRLNSLFYLADDAAIILNPYSWFHTLMCIFRELSTEMKENEILYFQSQKARINKELSVYIYNSKKGLNDVNPALYDLLDDFEVRLRRILKDSGLQQKLMDDAAKALR